MKKIYEHLGESIISMLLTTGVIAGLIIMIKMI